MKILLSAYACEPDKGSEPGVGWNWARTLVQLGHHVHVITRGNNRSAIESAISKEGLPLAVSYYDLPSWARWWKRGSHGVYLYYLLWQIGAYRMAKTLLLSHSFDRVHHITFASFRQPTFMGALGIPFVLGPVGGGETMPRPLRRGFPWRSRLLEILRDIGNAAIRVDPLMQFTFSRASLIACTTCQTLECIPPRYRSKCMVLPTIGTRAMCNTQPPLSLIDPPSFLYAGRLLYWKGIHLALRAVAQARVCFPNITLRIIGDGNGLRWLHRVAREYGIESAVKWQSWMPHESVQREYHACTAFLFPSLRDSGGLVVLEALAAACPVICLNLGGPGQIVNSSCGINIDVQNRDEDAAVTALAEAMMKLVRAPELRHRLASNCIQRANEYGWQHIVQNLYPYARGPQAEPGAGLPRV